MAENAGYDTIAAVYDFLVPDALLTPQGSADAFAAHVDPLRPVRPSDPPSPSARVLDCACGTGTLAVGLALRGCDVVATDASAAMVARTARLAAAHGAALQALVCTWEQIAGRGWDGRLRRRLLRRQLAVPRRRSRRAPGGAAGDGGDAAPRRAARRDVARVGAGARRRVSAAGRRAARRARRPPRAANLRLDDPAGTGRAALFDIAVALVEDDGAMQTHRERFAFWAVHRSAAARGSVRGGRRAGGRSGARRPAASS
jgi:SAM-dependent methyltransferase